MHPDSQSLLWIWRENIISSTTKDYFHRFVQTSHFVTRHLAFLKAVIYDGTDRCGICAS